MRRLPPALAGLGAALVWAAVDPLSRRLFRTRYSDVRLVGLPLHLGNGAVFGVVNARVPMSSVAFALLEHVTLWPLVGLFDPEAAKDARAFAKSGVDHALFGVVLAVLSRER
jgi:drug/metabolite transporter (DMT)-like permease